MAEPAALGNKMRRNEYACPPASKPRFPSVIAALIVASSLTLNCGPNRPPSISPVPTTPQATLAQPEAVRNSIATFISDLIARENSAFYFDPQTVAALTEFARELRIDQIASLTKTPTQEEIDALGVKVPVSRLKEMNIERVKLELLLDALRLNCEYEGNGELTLKDSLSNREGKGKRTFNCVGYAFLMYIYGEAIGIRNIKPVFVFLAENENHVALMVTLAKTHLVDATVSDGLGQSSYISEGFDFDEVYETRSGAKTAVMRQINSIAHLPNGLTSYPHIQALEGGLGAITALALYNEAESLYDEKEKKYANSKEYERLMRKALELTSGDFAWAHLKFAAFLEQQGRKEESRKHYESAERLFTPKDLFVVPGLQPYRRP